MPRAGLSAGRVVEVAAELADRDGLEAVTLTAVADAAEVRPPSLYAHVDGLDDLRRRLSARGAAELAAVMRDAAVGRSREEALRHLAGAYRDYAHAHPGLYLAAQRAPRAGDAAAEAAAGAAVEVIAAVLAGWGFEGSEAIHAIRGVRATLHGFVALEAAGAFGMPEDVDESFDRLVAMLVRGVATAGADGEVSSGAGGGTDRSAGGA
jgi:AcrR family transcriptional regulator